MKTSILIASIIVSSFIWAPAIHAQDRSAKRICEYISVNDKTRLRSFLKQNKLKIRNLYSTIQCNGNNILIFAAKSKALDTGEFIIAKLPKKMVQANLEDIAKLSAHLLEDAKDRVE